MSNKTISQTLNVWYIYLLLVNLYGKCRYIYHTLSVWVKKLVTDLSLIYVFSIPLEIKETTSQPFVAANYSKYCPPPQLKMKKSKPPITLEHDQSCKETGTFLGLLVGMVNKHRSISCIDSLNKMPGKK